MFNFKRKKPIKTYLPTRLKRFIKIENFSVFTKISLNATAYYNWIYLNLQMAVWAIDWRDQIWTKLINLILFCFNKVQKSISWNLPGFEIYKYSQNYYTHQILYQKKKIQYIFIHQVKDSSTFIFLASIQQMSNKWFLNKMHNISKQIEFAKTWFVYTLQSVSALGLLLLIQLSLSFPFFPTALSNQ